MKALCVFTQEVNRTSRLSHTALLLALLLFPFASFADEKTEPPLITIEQFCKLERSKVAKRETVRVRGTVTFINRTWQLLCIQDGDCALKVYMENDAELLSGDLVELTGRTEFGDDSNIMMLHEGHSVGKGTFPEPLTLDENTPFSLDLLYRWTEVEGPIYTAVDDDANYYVYVAGKEFGTFVTLPRSADFPPVNTLRSYRLKARGVLAISTEEKRPFRIDLLSLGKPDVEFSPEETPANGISLRPMADSGRRDMQGDSERPTRFRGVVRSFFPPDQLFLSDESGSLFVELADQNADTTLVPGDVVEVEGRINRNLYQPYLHDAQIQFMGKGYSEPPTSIKPGEGRKHIGNLIRTSGMLVSRDSEKRWLLLRKGGLFFRVWYLPKHDWKLSSADVGSQISAIGGADFSDSSDAAFDISAREIQVLFEIADAPGDDKQNADADNVGGSATGQTTETGQPEASNRDIVRPILMILLLVFLGVLIYLVNRRLREQERFQESIHEQLSNLSHIARLNTLSEMVGALAHELNQPLASVSNYAATAELLSKKEPANSEKLAGVLTNIGQEAFRAGEIIRRLRHLVRKKTPGSLPVHISEIVQETIELFKTQHVTANGLVQVDIPQNLPPVQADSVQIQQVVLNLLLNARDATEAQSDRTPAIQVTAHFEDGMVYVAVADNGIGIANADPDAIFEPYFTTREKGTGLGLAISRTIIETHGGKIVAENGSPHGTRIAFSLPVSRTKSVIAG